ncbi:zf-HC2 domain-containing protein [Nonomuraea rubra]|uniref:zf-HC2 domain-containing protein n=1 Tax=Nonomuraea rubra TaxID=46180 RepID=UPI003606772F
MLGKLGAYVRGGLARRDSKAVDEHVSACEECHGVLLELTDVNRGLRVMVGPLIAGPLFGGYAAALARPGAVGAGGALRLLRRLRRVPRQQQVAVAGGTVAVTAAVLASLLLVSDEKPVVRPPAITPVAQPPASVAPVPVPVPVPLPTQRPAQVPPPAKKDKPGKARLRATIDALGSLVRAQPGIVGIRLRNYGESATEELAAQVDLPDGVTLVPRRGAATAQRCSPPSARSTAGPAARSAAAPGAPGSRCRRGRARRCSCGCWWPTRRRRARGPPSASPPARCGSRPGPRRAYGPPARPPGSPPTGRWRSGRSATRC